MLTGEKGSGKTLLAKHLSITAAENGYSTLIVNAPYTDDGFHTLIQNINQPAMVLFDEFEKVYDSDDQQTVLTMLDGIFNSKKLFILTCNDRWRVDVHMRNRPGRLYYMLDFEGLDTAFVREYCEDNLKNRSHIDKVCAVSLVFDRFNFDMLKAIVEEMNRYNETPQQVLRMINARPEFSNDSNFDVTMFHNKRQVEADKMEETVWEGNPLSPDGFRFAVKVPNLNAAAEKAPKEVWNYVDFEAENLVKIDPNAGTFTFVNEDNWTVMLTRQKAKVYHYIDV
jgi:ATPase family associated with various cellular activities (AAA)